MEKYRIATVQIAGIDHYQVYELIDQDAPDEEKNRKKIGGLYENKWCAERLRDTLNKEKNEMNYEKEIQKYKRRTGKTYREMAEAVGVTTNIMEKWGRGKYEPKGSRRDALIAYLTADETSHKKQTSDSTELVLIARNPKRQYGRPVGLDQEASDMVDEVMEVLSESTRQNVASMLIKYAYKHIKWITPEEDPS